MWRLSTSLCRSPWVGWCLHGGAIIRAFVEDEAEASLFIDDLFFIEGILKGRGASFFLSDTIWVEPVPLHAPKFDCIL